MRIPSALVPECIEVRRRIVGGGGFGWSEPVSYAANVQPGERLVVSRDGEEVTANLTCLVAPGAEIDAGYRIDWEGRPFEVITADPIRMMGRTHHIEVAARSIAPEER